MAKINIQIEFDTRAESVDAIAAIINAFNPNQAIIAKPVATVTAEPTTKELIKEMDDLVDQHNSIKKSQEVQKEEAKKETKKEIKKEEPKEADVSIEDVRKVLADAKRAGKTNEQLKSILKNNGAEGVSQLDSANYKAVIEAVKAL